MGRKRSGKNTQEIKPFQIRWDIETQKKFDDLVERYDPMLPRATAVLKLIYHAIQDNWIPGYIRKEKVIDNELTKTLNRMEGRTGA